MQEKIIKIRKSCKGLIKNAENGIAALKKYSNTLITFSNINFFNNINKDLSFYKLLKFSNEILYQPIKMILDMLYSPGEKTINFDYLLSFFKNKSKISVGLGYGEGHERVTQALYQIKKTPEFNYDLVNAEGVLLNITGSKDLQLKEVNNICSFFTKQLSQKSEFEFGTSIDEQKNNGINIAAIISRKERELSDNNNKTLYNLECEIEKSKFTRFVKEKVSSKKISRFEKEYQQFKRRGNSPEVTELLNKTQHSLTVGVW